MSIPTYGEIIAQVPLLSPKEQVRLLEELVVILGQDLEDHQRHSTMELRGLRKECGQEIDIEKYIEEERNSWRG
jgi:hypothetical protein